MLTAERFEGLLRQLPDAPYDVHAGPDRTYTFHIRHRLRQTLQALEPFLQGRSEVDALDLGSFPGSFLRVAPRLWPETRFHFQAAGLAQNEAFLEDLQRTGIPFHHVDLDPKVTVPGRPATGAPPARLPLEGPCFDLFVATEVLEHLLDPLLLLREARRTARPDALLLVTTPNLATLYRRLRFLVRGRSPNVPIGEGIMLHLHDWRPHIREFTMEELAEMLSRTGWKPVLQRHYFAEPPSGRTPRRQVVDALLHAVARMVPSTATDLLIVARAVPLS